MYFIELSKPIYLGLVSENFTPQKIQNISLHDLHILRETYGKIEFGNTDYENKVKTIADQIKSDLKNGLKYDTKFNNELYFKRYYLYLSKCIKWINDITIYVSDIFEDQNDACIISRNKYNSYVIDTNEIDVYSCPFNLEDDKVTNVSIYINCVNQKDKNFDIFYTILHELKHIYDMYITKISEYDLDSDIVYSQRYNTVLNPKNKLILNDVNTQESFQKKHVLFGDVFKYIISNIYLLNKSEVQARIENTVVQLNNVDIEINIKDRKDLCEYSEIYKDYYWIYMRLKFCLLLSNSQKNMFNEYYIDIFNNMYKTKFKNYDELLTYLINRLDKLYFKHIINYLINQK